MDMDLHEAEVVVAASKARRKGSLVTRGVQEEGKDEAVESRRNPRRTAKPPSKFNDFLDPESL